MIRVVKVGSDIEACAGTHVTNTGMIGSIKILRAERIQDGVERIEFAAGEAAVRASQGRDDLLYWSCRCLACAERTAPQDCRAFLRSGRASRRRSSG